MTTWYGAEINQLELCLLLCQARVAFRFGKSELCAVEVQSGEQGCYRLDRFIERGALVSFAHRVFVGTDPYRRRCAAASRSLSFEREVMFFLQLEYDVLRFELSPIRSTTSVLEGESRKTHAVFVYDCWSLSQEQSAKRELESGT